MSEQSNRVERESPEPGYEWVPFDQRAEWGRRAMILLPMRNDSARGRPPADVVAAGELVQDQWALSDTTGVPSEGAIVDPRGAGEFRLSNRTWEEVQAMLAGLPGLAIEHARQVRPAPGVVRVLDLGAGVRGRAMSELQARYPEQNVRVFGVDLATSFTDPSVPRTKISADMRELPLEDACMDVIYCVQSAALMVGDESIQVTFREATRVLRPGGVFIADTALEAGWASSIYKRFDLPPDIHAYRKDRGEPHYGSVDIFIKDSSRDTHGAQADLQATLHALGIHSSEAFAQHDGSGDSVLVGTAQT